VKLEGISNDNRKGTKTATGLRFSKDHRCDRKGSYDGSGDLFGGRASNQGNPNQREEDQMTKPRLYSPQIPRDLVSRLYFKAKAEGIPMTRLASRLIEALDSDESNGILIAKENSREEGAE
jgi:hypothetical protein